LKSIEVIDSHTGGEPTRIIVSGGPDLGNGSLSEKLERFKSDYDHYRSCVVNEPRGSDVVVGGLLCEPENEESTAGIIFFNNVGYLGMCGHGTIGLLSTLQHMGRISEGSHMIDTPVGMVRAVLHKKNLTSVTNVDSYRLQADVSVNVPNVGVVTGDIAWGGNWFFLVKNGVNEELIPENAATLTKISEAIRKSLKANNITGTENAYIDHVELFTPAHEEKNDSRNFVLCPGSAYDRSPCGTGTSAKLACLAADGKLKPTEEWRQESVIGSVFSCSYEFADNGEHIKPTVTGRAFVNAESTILIDPNDPFRYGIGK